MFRKFSSNTMPDLIIEGQIIHCVAPFNLKVYEQGFIILQESSKILAIGNKADLEQAIKRHHINDYIELHLKKSQLLLPGLIDTHIHAPQYPNIGLGYDKPLLEWLENYTFPLEKKFKNMEYCEKIFDCVVKKTLDNGTTTACYYGSLFKDTTMALVEAVLKHSQRALVGKINMTRMAPDDYLETELESMKDTLDFIKELKLIKDNKLVQPVLTPRFALSVDSFTMKELGDIAKELNIHIQTHIAENKDEVQMVKEFYPECKNYADVYDKAHLLTPKTILAHGIYLSDEELDVIAERKTSISHCPESNTNLKSGLCDVRRLVEKGINVGLGTDVSGGSSPSIIATMKHALIVSNHISFIKENYQPLNYQDVFYLATLGGAKALAMDDIIGNFEEGKCFDAIIVDMNLPHNNGDYSNHLNPLQLLQKLIYTGDERNVITVFVNGKAVKNVDLK